MKECIGLGLYVDTARFIPTNAFIKNGKKTNHRLVTCYEVVLFIKDGGWYVINEKKYPISAGTVRFQRPGDMVYSYHCNELYVVHFNVDNEDKGKEVFDKIPLFTPLSQFEEEVVLFKKLITAFLNKNDLECVFYLSQLLTRIKSLSLQSQPENKEQKTNMIKNYIENNFSTPITLDVLASEFYLHPVYLQKKFKNETGITPSEYLKRVRISKAKAYLLTTDLSIDEISAFCGFCNTSHFIKTFKSHEKITPSQYRNIRFLPDYQI